MKLITKNNAIVATATDAYSGPDDFIKAPDGFDPLRMEDYLVVEGALVTNPASIISSVQKRLDDFAKSRNYDGILSLCTYATSGVPKFKAEGQYGVEARDATWAEIYKILADVEAGARPMPEGYTDIENELPALTWPSV